MSGKRIVALLLTMILILSLCACAQSDDSDKEEGKKRGSLKTEGNVTPEEEEPTPEEMEITPTEELEPTPTEEIIVTPIEEPSSGVDDEMMAAYGFTKMLYAYFKLPDDLTIANEDESTITLLSNDQTKCLYVSVQDVSGFGYTTDELIEQMQTAIENEYGTNYTLDNQTFVYNSDEDDGIYRGDMEWLIFDFPEGNQASDKQDVSCYLYTDGTIMVYVEDAHPLGETAELADDFMYSVVFAEEH